MTDKTPRASFDRSADPDQEKIRDKDNANPKPKPSFAQKPAPNLAPPGMMGIRRSLPSQETHPPKVDPEMAAAKDLRLDTDQKPTDLWIDGRIMSMPAYSFQAKLYDAPSEHGIDGGTISTLELRKDGALVANYDRGWDKPPRTPEEKQAVHIVKQGLDPDPDRDFKPIAPHDPDKDRGHSR